MDSFTPIQTVIQQLTSMVKATIQALPNVLIAIANPPPEALVVGLAESTVNIRARWWVNPPRRAEVLDSQDWVLTELCNKLVMAGIDLPFPTQQILFHDRTDERDGDRARQREGWPAKKGDNPKPRRIVDYLQSIAQNSSDNSRGNAQGDRDINSEEVRRG